MSGDVQTWATTEELAGRYITRAHQLAHDMQYASLRVTRGSLQSERSWRAAVDERKEFIRAEIETLRGLARDLVPDSDRYAEVAQTAISRADDVTCSRCYGRVFLSVGEDGRAPQGVSGGPVEGSDGKRYGCDRIRATTRLGVIPPL